MVHDDDGARVTSVEAAAYTVPTPAPESDGTLTWDATTVVTVHVRTPAVHGLGWTYGAGAVAALVRDLLAPVVTGRDVWDVPNCFEAMRATARNAMVPGAVGTAISAVDVALWDAKAKLLDQPLCRLLGTAGGDRPVYGSGGFTSYDDDALRAELAGWVQEQGIGRVKIKIGEAGGAAESRDLHRIRVAREAIGPDAELYVDANGGYHVKQAIRVERAAAEQDVRWFEEPVTADDLAGLAAVRGQVGAEVAAGEYGTDPGYFRRMCAAGAVDCLQVDLTRCGGCTGFLRAAAVADSFHAPVSTHTAAQLHAQVAPAAPNVRDLEWFADHVRADAALFDGTTAPVGGAMEPARDRPGHGMWLREPDAERYRTG